jgi:hypothetical protein
LKSESFIYWLQGYAELAGESGGLSEAQWKCVKAHLALVFRHEIDPSMGDEKHQAELDKIHGQGMSVNPHGVVMRC